MDNALKQRLVGASVLIALAVVVLPMLLGGRPEGDAQQSEQIELPSRPDGLSFETRRFPLSEDSEPRPEDSPELPAPAPQKPDPVPGASAEPVPALAADEQAVDEPGAPSAAEVEGLPPVSTVEVSSGKPADLNVAPVKPTPVPEKPPASGRFAVQVASLGSAANAKRLQNQLEGQGYQVMVDHVESDVGRLNRVRVGPYDTEADAVNAVNRIRSQVDGVNPRAVDLDPSASSQVTSPSDPLVRWVVQLGSFGESSNAENLVKQVREQGMSAYSELVTTSSGSAINRVLVGPFLQREDATKAQQSLKTSLNISGVVMSAD
jgi:cell division septation protein DedD